jgi:hypothetical protein
MQETLKIDYILQAKKINEIKAEISSVVKQKMIIER